MDGNYRLTGLLPVAVSYTPLGIEHIGFGIDHLLCSGSALSPDDAIDQDSDGFAVAHASAGAGPRLIRGCSISGQPRSLFIVFVALEIIRRRGAGRTRVSRAMDSGVTWLLTASGLLARSVKLVCPQTTFRRFVLFHVGVEIGRSLYRGDLEYHGAGDGSVNAWLYSQRGMARSVYSIGGVAAFDDSTHCSLFEMKTGCSHSPPSPKGLPAWR
jgi:hypothetical protein